MATDFSAHAEERLAQACRVADRLGCRDLYVVHVVSDKRSSIPGFHSTKHADAEAQKLEALQLPETRAKLHREIRRGSRAAELSKVAVSRGAGLLVALGKPRPSLAERVLGSVTGKLARTTKRPLLVLGRMPADFDGGFRRVLAAIDGSAVSSEVIAQALHMARASGGEVQVLSVYEPSSMGTADLFSAGKPEDAEARQADFERHLNGILRRAPRGGVPMHHRLLAAHAPREAILEAVSQMEADLLVIGSSGQNAIQHMLLGSTAEAALLRSPCPVLVVPAWVAEQRPQQIMAGQAAGLL